MRKFILLVHTSLDGFVAGEGGGFEKFKPGKDNLEFVCGLTKQADAALVGRVSYQLLNAYWPMAYKQPNATKDEINYSQWYNNSQKIVISRTLNETNAANTTIIGEDLKNKLLEIKQKAGKDILMFGSPSTFRSLFQLGLIDECWIILYPVLFGNGIPLFIPAKDKTTLRLLETKQLSNSEIALHYEVVRDV